MVILVSRASGTSDPAERRFALTLLGWPRPLSARPADDEEDPAQGVTTGPELESELLAFLRERIAGYKVPRGIDFLDSLPRTETGKLQKHRIRERYQQTEVTR